MSKVYKYSEFLVETIHGTPESYIRIKLRKLKERIEKMFSGAEVENGEVVRYGEKKDLDRKEKGEMSFIDLGLQKQSLQISKSKLYHRLKLQFSDEEFLYSITFTVDLKDAIPQSKEKDYSDEEIKKCQITFVKYDIDDFGIIAELPPETANIEDIDEEFLVKLKIKLDEGEKEEFEIETE
jgi:hypothetical protein